jgi:D-alanyl-D-alanine carboxypeptidase
MRRPAFVIGAVLLTACGSERAVPPTTTTAPLIAESTTTTSSVPVEMPTTSLPDISVDWKAFDFIIASETVGRGSDDVQVAVVRNGRILHRSTTSSPTSLAEVTDSSRFRIASISKLVTAYAVMRLVEDGRIGLDDMPLKEAAGRLGMSLADPRMESITVQQLLSHTSGIGSSSDVFFDSPGTTSDDALRTVLSTPLASDPGRNFEYSNANFVILGRLIGWRTGQSWDGATRNLVLEPLGLRDWIVGTTTGHEEGDAQHRSKEGRNYMELLEASGAWLASASDVALLVDALSRDELFRTPAPANLMRTPSSSGPDDENWEYGLGVRIFANGAWGHSGTLESAHDMVVKLDDGTVVAVFVNGEEPSDTDALLDLIVRALAGR